MISYATDSTNIEFYFPLNEIKQVIQNLVDAKKKSNEAFISSREIMAEFRLLNPKIPKGVRIIETMVKLKQDLGLEKMARKRYVIL